jgi:tetratricopeptide (TPR) repeat protein
VHPELVYALAPERDGTQIDDALAVLDSHVVFLSDDTQPVSDRTDATPYETVHGTWSAEFLAHALETEGDRSMHRRVGRCLTAVLALADDSTRREEVNWRLHGQTPYLGRMSTSPEAWADNTVTRLFSLGLEQAQLAPLFGTTEYSRIELPDACSPELRLRCIEWRGRMYIDAGSPDRAEREFRQLADTAGEVDALAERSTELRARSFRYLGKIAQKKGALQEAEEYLDRGLELARRAEAEKLEADCLNERAGVDWMRGTFDDETERQMERALDLYRDIGAVEPEIKLLQNLGLTFVQRGRFEAAGEHLDRSLVLAREIDATQSKVSGLLNEGHLAYRRGDIDTAEQHWTHALDFARESGHRQPEAILLNNLGEVARESEEYDTAEAYYTQSLDLARQIDARKSVARAHSNLALLALQRGDFATADERASESLELRREMNDQRGEAVTLRILGRLAVRRGDFAAAEERLTRSRGLTSDIDDPYLEARTVLAMGELATAREEFADARETLTEAATLAEEIGAARLTLEITDSLVDACEELDDEETLGKWCTTAVEMAREAGLEEEQQTFREAVPVDVDS